MKKQMNLLTDSTKGLFMRYLLPSISATLVTSIYILADTIMIGKGIGAVGIAALNVLLPIYNILFGLGMLFGIGGAVLMSIAFGQGDKKGGREYFTTSSVGVLITALLSWLIFFIWFDPIVRILGATQQTISLVREYGYILIAAGPLFIISSMLQAFVRNDKGPNTAMTAVIAGGITNVVLDYIFIFILNLGMKGAILATVTGTSLTIVILLTHFLKKENNLKFIRGGFTFRRLGKVSIQGFASFLVEISSGIVIWLFNIQLIRLIGDIGVTVYGIISNSALVALSLANGIAQAAQPIIAQNYGAGNKKRVADVSKLAVGVAAIVGVLLMVIGELFPATIASAFVDVDNEILSLAVPAIRIYFLSFVVATINVFFSNYYQSIMKAERSLLISVLRGLILSAFFVFLLPLFFGVKGIWITMPITELITFLVIISMNKGLRFGNK